MRFLDEQIRRYSRQIVLPEIGGNGQEELGGATLTAASEVEALYLAAAGVGTVIVPNEAIAESVRALNPLVQVAVGNVPVVEHSVVDAALFAWRALKETLSL